MGKITGYPDFARVKDEDVRAQFRYVWDALKGISKDVAAIEVPDVSAIEAAVDKLERRQALLQNDVSALQVAPDAFVENHGGTIVNPNGITAAINVITWIAPYACTVTAVKGYRVGGTSASINARLNGASNHLSSALSLTSTDTWMDGGAVQNTAYAAGDKLEIMLTAVGGSPTQIGVSVYFTRA